MTTRTIDHTLVSNVLLEDGEDSLDRQPLDSVVDHGDLRSVQDPRLVFVGFLGFWDYSEIRNTTWKSVLAVITFWSPVSAPGAGLA